LLAAPAVNETIAVLQLTLEKKPLPV
jgi:hypothetical protein